MTRSAHIALCLLATCLITAGQDRYVSHWGSHTPPYDSLETAATNLTTALEAAPDNATVWVDRGIYRDGTYDDGNLPSRARVARGITLRSLFGERSTAIEGSFHAEGTPNGPNAVRALLLLNGLVDGFTLRKGATNTNGVEAAIAGGGLRATGGTIQNSRINGNHGYTAGGGWFTQTTLSNITFSANYADTGPRVKVGQQVQMHEVYLHADGNQFPDMLVQGTNAQAITNGEYATSTDLGTDFGVIHALTGSLTHVFSITNEGTRELVIEDIMAVGGDTNDWQILQWPSNAILPGASAPLEVHFDPVAPGFRRTLLFLANNDPDDDPYGIWLSGESIQADMLALAMNGTVISNGNVTPLIALGTDFGDIRLTGDPGFQSYVVTNRGTADLILTNIFTADINSADFQVTVPAAFPEIIPPGATGLVTVAFAPLELDYRATLLRFEGDAVNTPYLFGIMGRGVEPWMQVSDTNNYLVPNDPLYAPSIINNTDFGTYANTPLRNTFRIHNSGTYPLALTGTPTVVIAGMHTNDFFVRLQPSITNVAEATYTSFDVEFIPSATGIREALVQIQSDDVYYTNTLYQFKVRANTETTNQFIELPVDIASVTAGALKWGDLDNDGLADLVLLGFNGVQRVTTLYRNLGNSSFADMNAGLPGLDAGAIALADFNQDGWIDIAISGMSNAGPITRIYRNNGDGTFTDIEAGLPGTYNGALEWGDYNNDGAPDLFLSGYTASGSISSLYRNDGNETFTLRTIDMPAMRDATAAWLDVDGDGYLDLFASGLTDDGRQAALLRNQGGSFTNTILSTVTGKTHGDVAVADLNANGTADLATTGFSDVGQDSRIYLNTSGEFGLGPALPPLWLGTVVAGDLSNNGWPDLILNGADVLNDRYSFIFMNNNATLSVWPSEVPGLRVSSVALGDSDNDSDLDIAIAGFAPDGPYSAIYRNLASTANAPPTAPTDLQVTLTNGNTAIFSWGVSADDSTPTAALTYNIFVGSELEPISIVSPHADLATGRRKVFEAGNTRHSRTWRIEGLPAGETLTWGVQAIDSSYAGSTFATGTTFEIPLMPDYAISDIDIRVVPFLATVTITNQGNYAGTGGVVSVWLNSPNEQPVGATGDLTAHITSIDAGDSQTFEFSNFTLPTISTNHRFRAFVNSNHAIAESNYLNNQTTVDYTHTVYEPFWFRAVALTNNVYLRWIEPSRIGMSTNTVLLRYKTSSYPTNTTDGTFLYSGDAQFYEHTGLTPNQPYLYTIWVTHDGTEWLEPPE